MPNYLRPKVTGATVFFTVALAQRGGSLLVDEVEALRAAVRATRAERPFQIDAWVVLPDHLHCVWTLPAGDCDYGTRWGAIKAQFSMSCRRVRACTHRISNQAAQRCVKSRTLRGLIPEKHPNYQ